MFAIQYGRALERLTREFIMADPSLVPLHVLKADVGDGFYLIGLHHTNAPKKEIFFPLE